jgi:hypothetical protein
LFVLPVEAGRYKPRMRGQAAGRCLAQRAVKSGRSVRTKNIAERGFAAVCW